MKVLLTGSNGQLGVDILKRLGVTGDEVVAYSHSELDITDRAAVMEKVGEISPDVIINAAAYTAVDKAEEEEDKVFAVNAGGAGNVADAARDNKALLVAISSDFIFDGDNDEPYVETDPIGPLGVYGDSKLRGEEEIQKSGCDYVIMRTSWLYGVNGNNFVKTILKLAAEKDELKVVNDQVGSPTWTGDLADQILSIAGKGSDGIWVVYHYANEGAVSWYDFAVAIVEEARAVGMALKCSTITPIPTSDYPTPAERPAYSVLSTEKIKRELGITIPPWRESLKKMIKELKEAEEG